MKKHGLGQAYWNAHQVYTWVYTRNPRLVVLLSDCDERDSVEPSVIDFFAMTSRPGAEFANYAETQEAIVSTLQEGLLRSLGRREGAGAFEDIPAVEWIDLHFVWHVFHGLVKAIAMTDNPPSSIVGAPRWYGLKFKRDDVLELWPPTETEVETEAENPRRGLQEADARSNQQQKKAPKPRGGGGRKPGSGAYMDQDLVLFQKMKVALEKKTAVSRWAATRLFVDEAAGEGTDDSKRRRLSKGYKRWIIAQ